MSRLGALGAAFFVALVLLGCDASRPTSKSVGSRPLVLGAFDEPTMINPVLSTSGISAILIDFIFDALVRIDENMEVRPGLAASWDVSDSGLVWTFHLRRGVSFHDGSPLTAEDVKFTFEVISDPDYVNPYSHVLGSVKEVVVRDDQTVEIVLRQALPSLPYYLYIPIIPRSLYQGEDLRTTRLNQRPVGTGPYVLKGWSEAGLVMEANQGYYLGRPKIGTIIVKVFENPRAAWAGLMSGSVDFAFFMEPATLEVVSKLPHLKTYSTVKPYYNMVVFNQRNGLFRQRSVRQAMNYAIDKGRLVEEVLGGLGAVVSGLTMSGSPFEPKEDLSYPYDPAEASRLLSRAGWADVDDDGILERDGREFRFALCVPEEGFLQEKAVLLIQRQLAEVGIQARLDAVSLKELVDHYLKGKSFEAIFWNFIAVGDPGINHLYWSSSQIYGGLNVFGYSNARVDELLDRGLHSLELAERVEAYRAFQREFFRDPPGIFLHWRVEHYVAPSSLRGVSVGPGGPFLSVYRWYFEPRGEGRR